jgi:hypothetical protein
MATVHSLCTLTSENRFMSWCCTHDEEGYKQDPGEWPEYQFSFGPAVTQAGDHLKQFSFLLLYNRKLANIFY